MAEKIITDAAYNFTAGVAVSVIEGLSKGTWWSPLVARMTDAEFFDLQRNVEVKIRDYLRRNRIKIEEVRG